MADLVEKLKRMALRTQQRGTDDLREGLRDLADTIADALDDHDLRHDRITARDCVRQAVEGAALLNAYDVFRHEVASDARIRDFKLPSGRTYDRLQRFLDDEARPFGGEASFVYVAWARNPDQYNYVGMSDNRDGRADRLKLDARGKLLGALQDSTVFTMIVPRREPRPIAADIEAALLSILDDNEAFPARNGRSEKVPSAAGSAHLRRVGELLTRLGAEFLPGSNTLARALSRSQ